MIKGVLFQESLHREPFWMLVACCLVNCTRWMEAEPVYEEIRRRWPTCKDLAFTTPEELYPVVRRLGFGQRRSVVLVKMAKDYMEILPQIASDVTALTGCGRYARDSWAIFVDGRRDVEPSDKELRAWLEREKVHG